MQDWVVLLQVVIMLWARVEIVIQCLFLFDFSFMEAGCFFWVKGHYPSKIL